MKSWRTLLETGSVAGLSDDTLLERFAARRDGAAEAAFAGLVSRHGPMVQGVCRRLLANPADAEDAFQATFLVLARKAGRIRRPERLASWLYGTAYRVSRKLKVQAARRRKHESVTALTGDEASPEDDPGQREACRAVFEEVARLPEAYRVVMVLHALEGLTQDEAARHLGCSDRTFRRRWVRSCNLLRRRLIRRGLAPTAATIAATLGPGPASAGISEAATETLVEAAMAFAAGKVPATASVVILARGVIQAMLWNKLKASAIAVGLVLGVGIGVRLATPLASASAKGDGPVVKQDAANTGVSQPSPADQYRALMKRYEDAMKIYQDAPEGKTEAETLAIEERLSPVPDDHVPAFVALAERYPNDPVAVDALLWVVNKGPGWGPITDLSTGAIDRAMDMLVRNHAGDPRLGPLCLEMISHLSPRNNTFLKDIAERSPNRTVKGQATFALAESLKLQAMWVEIHRRPDAPESIAKLRAWVESLDPEASDQRVSDRVAKTVQNIKSVLQDIAKDPPDDAEKVEVEVEGDPEALRRESDQLYARVLAEYGDVPYIRRDHRPTRATLGEAARDGLKPEPTVLRDDRRFRIIVKAFKDAQQRAFVAKRAAGEGEAGEKAFLAATPKWADFGPKMWALAEEIPGSSAALDALLWIFGNTATLRHGWFLDAREERFATLGKAVDVLVRDHLDAMDKLIRDNPGATDDDFHEPGVSQAFFEGPYLAPHVDRLYQALHERARSRETRGRIGLTLALQLRDKADLVELLAVHGNDPTYWDPAYLAHWEPAYIEQLRRSDHRAIVRQAEVLFERVKAGYGDVCNRNAMGRRPETVGTLADIELAEIRTLNVGQTAPEIKGEEGDGTLMTLSEFRGKVVLLAFFHHDVCGCRQVYPHLRTIVEQFRGRPLVVLGVNNDRRDDLRQLKAKGEITWRCWWDGDLPDLDARGPIASRWNIKRYLFFIVLDHRGAIRFKNFGPYNGREFVEAIESLVKQAEIEATRP